MADVVEASDDKRFPWTAIPAVAALVVCVALTAIIFLKSARPDVDAIKRRADAALAAGDTATAQLDYQHLLALEPDRPRHAYDLARSLDKSKRRREAAAVLGTIAPATGGGYAPAQLLLAEWAVEARVLGGATDPAVLKDVPTRLDAAAGEIALQGRVRELRAVLAKIPASQPATRPEL